MISLYIGPPAQARAGFDAARATLPPSCGGRHCSLEAGSLVFVDVEVEALELGLELELDTQLERMGDASFGPRAGCAW